MKIGDQVITPDGRTVIITNGQFWGKDGLSNFWYFQEVLLDGSLGPEECSYGWTPVSIHTYTKTIPSQYQERIPITAVLLVTHNTVCVKYGHGNEKWIVHHGLPLDISDAKFFFPDIENIVGNKQYLFPPLQAP